MNSATRGNSVEKESAANSLGHKKSPSKAAYVPFVSERDSVGKILSPEGVHPPLKKRNYLNRNELK